MNLLDVLLVAAPALLVIGGDHDAGVVVVAAGALHLRRRPLRARVATRVRRVTAYGVHVMLSLLSKIAKRRAD